EAIARKANDKRVEAAFVDASNRELIADLIRQQRITHVLNAVDPRFVMPIFDACLEAGADYLDMAMSLSKPHPAKPYELPGVKLGDEQFAQAEAWSEAGRLALVGMGVEPGLSDVFARSFSIWTTIEECLNPPVIWERGRDWYTTAPFSEPEVFDFPEGIGPVEC